MKDLKTSFKYYVLVMQVQKGKAKLMISCNQLSVFIRWLCFRLMCKHEVSNYLHSENISFSKFCHIFYFSLTSSIALKQGKFRIKICICCYLLNFLTKFFSPSFYSSVNYSSTDLSWIQMTAMTVFPSKMKIINFRGEYRFNKICRELIIQTWVMGTWGFVVLFLYFHVFLKLAIIKVF